jgi:16S rRNA (guanine966-N2)-methyltransferase
MDSMRIISGEFRRRQLETPPDAETTRPIPDRVKESLFQVLRGHFEDATVFDGFAGTGAIGLETVSRGARHVVLVEKDRDVAEMLRRNVASLGVASRCEVVQGDALGPGALARAMRPLHLAFLDPPYPLVQEPIGFRRVMAQMAALVAMLDDTGYAVLRTPWPLELRAQPMALDEHATFPVKHKKKGNERNAWKHELRRSEEGRGDARSGKGGGMHAGRGTPSEARHAPGELDEDGDQIQWLEDDAVDALRDAGEKKDAQIADAAGAPGATANEPPLVPADLTVVGAVGPETHAYTGMAIHFYMRQK